MSDVLEFAGVGVRRGTAELLRDITWSVEEGERWVVIGPNGAGKTTLLQLAAARMHPTTGVAGVLGEVLGAVDVFDLRPRIGVASSAVADRIPDEERVSDVVVTAAYGVLGRWREEYDASDEQRATELLEALGVSHLAQRRFGTLSEGERKRVQIARALMTDPELMLLDEPAAGLDLRGREDLVGRLSLLAEDLDAPAMVLVTHHVEEIPPGFTDILMLRDGEVVAAGPIEVTLTADNLSSTFGIPLVVDRHGPRWSARAAQPEPAADAAVGGSDIYSPA
ncbi:ABC transporter ATP-binding protein [Ornithinimicrobium avium]|uniref:ABC transporter ATP-binding protein n=1 Tax=Ornithinimicrobium avium TaxID=2283195 RepID=A0A345NJG3_9MICO|nr:ABC transporter ATP-binding protein [Ornithinimicrobium avium]AXH95171.1 ABC transporter ATP-binding protein [Ornithinimicrobium avium]